LSVSVFKKDKISKWPGICSELKYLRHLCEAKIATMEDLKVNRSFLLPEYVVRLN